MNVAETSSLSTRFLIPTCFLVASLLLGGCGGGTRPSTLAAPTPPSPTVAPTATFTAVPPTHTAAPPTGTPTLSPQVVAWLGVWEHADPDASGVARMEVSIIPEGLHVGLWGVCHPEDCDIGIWTIPFDQAEQGEFNLSYSFARGTDNLEFSLLPDGRVQVDTFVDFTEESGIADKQNTEFLVRAES